jgi:hypothetical protein
VHDDDDDEYDESDEEGSEIDLEAWPRGIIKTVSVEVVEEIIDVRGDAAGGSGNGGGTGALGMPGMGIRSTSRLQQRIGAGDADRVSGASVVEQDWEAMLRAGPPR